MKEKFLSFLLLGILPVLFPKLGRRHAFLLSENLGKIAGRGKACGVAYEGQRKVRGPK